MRIKKQHHALRRLFLIGKSLAGSEGLTRDEICAALAPDMGDVNGNTVIYDLGFLRTLHLVREIKEQRGARWFPSRWKWTGPPVALAGTLAVEMMRRYIA